MINNALPRLFSLDNTHLRCISHDDHSHALDQSHKTAKDFLLDRERCLDLQIVQSLMH